MPFYRAFVKYTKEKSLSLEALPRMPDFGDAPQGTENEELQKRNHRYKNHPLGVRMNKECIEKSAHRKKTGPYDTKKECLGRGFPEEISHRHIREQKVYIPKQIRSCTRWLRCMNSVQRSQYSDAER